MPKRKNIRLKEYNYKSQGYYFVTICTKNMEHFFGEIIDYKVFLNENGNSIKYVIDNFNVENVEISFYQIMPNHLHIIFNIKNDLNMTLSNVISLFKSQCTYKMSKKNIWQKGFYERIIRDEKEYNSIVKYIDENPYREKYEW